MDALGSAMEWNVAVEKSVVVTPFVFMSCAIVPITILILLHPDPKFTSIHRIMNELLPA